MPESLFRESFPNIKDVALQSPEKPKEKHFDVREFVDNATWDKLVERLEQERVDNAFILALASSLKTIRPDGLQQVRYDWSLLRRDLERKTENERRRYLEATHHNNPQTQWAMLKLLNTWACTSQVFPDLMDRNGFPATQNELHELAQRVFQPIRMSHEMAIEAISAIELILGQRIIDPSHYSKHIGDIIAVRRYTTRGLSATQRPEVISQAYNLLESDSTKNYRQGYSSFLSKARIYFGEHFTPELITKEDWEVLQDELSLLKTTAFSNTGDSTDAIVFFAAMAAQMHILSAAEVTPIRGGLELRFESNESVGQTTVELPEQRRY